MTAWLVKMAWRDSRSHRRKLLLFTSSIAIGIGALVGMGSLSATLEGAIDEQAAALLGADMTFESRQPFNTAAAALIDSIGGTQAHQVSFNSMVYLPKSQGTRLAQIRALRGPFPFYGKLKTAPAAAAQSFRSRPEALVDEALVSYAVKTYGAKKPGMILVNNAWGESNQKGLKDALQAANLPAAGIEKYEANDVDMVPQLSRLKEAGADALFLVGNVGPSAQVVKSLDRMGWSVPVVSHWGPAGGRFDELAGPSAGKVHFIQTFTFAGNASPKASAVLDALKAKYPAIKSMADVTPAVGIANAYDATHLLALAIQAAGSTEGPKVRDGFYKIGTYPGLIKTYDKPFAPGQHDALGPNDYVFTRFKDGEIVAVTN